MFSNANYSRSEEIMASLGLQEIMIILVLGTSLWVLFDAINLKVKRGKIEGFFDMGVAEWFFACLLLWIVGFPVYLAKRGEYKRLKQIGNVPLKIVADPKGTISQMAVAQIGTRYQDKPTEELLDIWRKNDRATYRKEVFEAIRQILVDRKCDLPPQDQLVLVANNHDQNVILPVGGTRRCPYCAEEIQLEAIVCKHCGRHVGSTPPIEAKKPPSKIVIFGGGFIVLCLLIAVVGQFMTNTTGTRGSSSLFSSTDSFTIKVTGDQGLEFQGGYMVVQSGSSDSKSVEGEVPAKYEVQGVMVSVSFQKKGEAGRLRVEIFKNGVLIKSADTTAAYGVVSVATQ
jgi:hypothetical protein